jgi:hypothetical protein
MRFSPLSVAAALSCISTTSLAFAARRQGSAFGANSSLSFSAVSHSAHPLPQFRLRFPPDDAEDGDGSEHGVDVHRASRAVEKRDTSGLSPDGSCLVLGAPSLPHLLPLCALTPPSQCAGRSLCRSHSGHVPLIFEVLFSGMTHARSLLARPQVKNNQARATVQYLFLCPQRRATRGLLEPLVVCDVLVDLFSGFGERGHGLERGKGGWGVSMRMTKAATGPKKINRSKTEALKMERRGEAHAPHQRSSHGRPCAR